MIKGVDWGWPNGKTPALAEGAKFVFVEASTGNYGNPFHVYDSYHAQVDRARKLGVEVGHYFFNGSDPAKAADFFVDHLYDFRKGRDVIALDLEDDPGISAWTPAQALVWLDRVHARTGVPKSAMLAYMNQNVNYRHAWSPVARAGYRLWYARPTGSATDQRGWSQWDVRQTGIVGGIDQDEARLSFAEMNGGAAPATVGNVTAKPGPGVGYNLTSRPVKSIQKLVGAKPDGIYLTETTAKVKAWQKAHGLVADGIWGPKSDAKGFPKKTAKPESKKPSVAPKTPPKFPLPAGSYFGPEGGPAQSVSGWHGHRADVKRAQQQLHDRGYSLAVDGYYSAKGVTNPASSVTGSTVGAFQKDKGLKVDHLLGPVTWAAMWTEPVT